MKKDDIRIETIGTLDELNSWLGVIRSEDGDDFLEQIQRDLFELGVILLNTKSTADFSETQLENWTKKLESELPPLKNFILPGGHPLAAKVHLARAVCRRAERAAVQIKNLPKGALPYLNRLSDFLFLFARKINIDSKTQEAIWKKM